MTIAALSVLLPFTSLSAQTNTEITEQESNEIAIEAYVYLHPLLTMDVTRRVVTNVPKPQALDGRWIPPAITKVK